MIDGHVHIERGNYSVEWLNQFIQYAVDRKITEIHFLEHSHRFLEFKDAYRTVASCNEYQQLWLERRMQLPLEAYINLISEAKRLEFPIKISFGLEVCYIEGAEEAINNALKGFQGDFLTGSVHWINGWGFDHKKEFWLGKEIDAIYRAYYETMKNLIRTGLFDTVAHPDSIKCFGFYPSYDLTGTYSDIADLLNDYGMSAEQSAGLFINYGHSELGLNPTMLDIFLKKKVKLITASDAHKPEDTGKFIKELGDLQAVRPMH